MSSDLRARFNNSPELEPTAEQQELERDRQRAKQEPTEREKFLAKHPEFSSLQREEVSGANKAGVLEKVRSFRLENLKQELAKPEYDLSEEEQKFAAEVLSLRISRHGSVRELVDSIHVHSAEDAARATADAKEIRRMRARHDALKGRYRTMPDFHVTPESFVVKPL